ncbi:MAG: hypothetical protein RL387_2003 [Bacteroidota bacterium]|jgi:tetrahydromethanopterin S-methyltransferase subunit G
MNEDKKEVSSEDLKELEEKLVSLDKKVNNVANAVDELIEVVKKEEENN